MPNVDFTDQWTKFGAAVTGVGALGVASFGLVESAGKALAYRGYGLPHAGFGIVKSAIRPLDKALRVAYGDDYMEIISQQYRAGRSAGRAQDTIRQGVRLGLPFMELAAAEAVIQAMWDLPADNATALAAALQAPGAPAHVTAAAPEIGAERGQALAGRFATALDARVSAAFSVADERYEAYAKGLAGVAAIGLALLFNYGLGSPFSTALTLVIGAVAVPLAPVAKDVSTSLQNALTAFKTIADRS